MFAGLTGGIGCGKSTVLRFFSLLDWSILDADAICHSLYEDKNSGISAAVLDRWGKKILAESGGISRRKIADIIFKNRLEQEWLNSIIHPKIFEKAKNEAENRKKRLIFDVPLLFEAGWEKEFDVTIAVWIDRNTRFSRLKKRGLSYSEIKRRSKFQISSEKKLEKADFGLINTDSEDFLFEQCRILNDQIGANYGKKRI